MAPEIEVSGPAVYAFEQLAITHCALEYTVLVAGSPREVTCIARVWTVWSRLENRLRGSLAKHH